MLSTTSRGAQTVPIQITWIWPSILRATSTELRGAVATSRRRSYYGLRRGVQDRPDWQGSRLPASAEALTVGSGTGVVRDSNGNLDGTVTSGGDCRDCGLVFKITRPGARLCPHDFTEEEVQPVLSASQLLLDSAGNLYGTTLDGGSISDGTVFEVSSEGV